MVIPLMSLPLSGNAEGMIALTKSSLMLVRSTAAAINLGTVPHPLTEGDAEDGWPTGVSDCDFNHLSTVWLKPRPACAR